MDHSASLVEIADQLSDLPFDRISLSSCSILQLRLVWIIRQHGTALWNCSAIRRLLFLTVDLSFPSGLNTLVQKARIKPFWQFADWILRQNKHLRTLILSKQSPK
ncbi:hypothetical protein H5410_036376 [Solanum commersonii]|uniref:Uncharacterized protein n=1 Tax=Solanum commersonii TaxID=4109 RepID=A0A9J5Y6B9_SOLCO|nr:hypothetical protein H5410_036376 [Solanum commersonii]